MLSGDAELVDHMRQVHLAREALQALAAKLGSEVTTIVRRGDEVVVTASFGAVPAGAFASRAGYRAPFVLPLGSVHAAWRSAALRKLGTETEPSALTECDLEPSYSMSGSSFPEVAMPLAFHRSHAYFTAFAATALAAVLVPLSITGQAHAASSLVANGDEAVIDWSLPSPSTIGGWADVFRIDSTSVWLDYGVVDQSTGTMLQQGSGYIPGNDLSGSGAGDLTLAANTATDPGITRTAGAGGPIDITWHRLQAFDIEVSGSQRFNMFGQHILLNGTQVLGAASVRGTEFGYAVDQPYTYATVGASHYLSISTGA